MNLLANTKTPITLILIALCILCFIPTTNNMLPVVNDYGLYFNENPQYHPFQYITSLFMHGSLMHLLSNMLGLWMFGSTLERQWGSKRFLVFYLLAGIGAGLFNMLVNEYQFQHLSQQLQSLGLSARDIQNILDKGVYPSNVIGLTESLVMDFYITYHFPVIGASGAIYGVLVAYAMCYPKRKLIFIFLPYPIATKYFVPILLSIDLFSGITGFSIFGNEIAYFAHVGGAIIGFLFVLIFGKK